MVQNDFFLSISSNNIQKEAKKASGKVTGNVSLEFSARKHVRGGGGGGVEKYGDAGRKKKVGRKRREAGGWRRGGERRETR